MHPVIEHVHTEDQTGVEPESPAAELLGLL